MITQEERKTEKQRIMDALNSMPSIRNKKVRKEFARIYNIIYEICEG